MENRLEFRKWGQGSNCYEVIWLYDYNVITKRFRYKSVGVVQKEGSKWVALGVNGNVVGKTRREVADKLVGLVRNV